MQTAFVEEEVKQHVNQAIESTLSTAVYTHSKVPQWTSDVVEGAMKKLTQLQKPFKYIGAQIPVLRYVSEYPCAHT